MPGQSKGQSSLGAKSYVAASIASAMHGQIKICAQGKVISSTPPSPYVFFGLCGTTGIFVSSPRVYITFHGQGLATGRFRSPRYAGFAGSGIALGQFVPANTGGIFSGTVGAFGIFNADASGQRSVI
jgi:hypothetical protein